MFKKLEELKQDVTDGISSVAQRGVQAVQELINSPYTAVELSQKEIDFYGDIFAGVSQNNPNYQNYEHKNSERRIPLYGHGRFPAIYTDSNRQMV